MLAIWFYAVGSVVVVSLISLVGVIALALNESRLRQILFFLVALAAGALFGDVTIHLLPEIFAGGEANAAALTVLTGILIFFSLEKFLHWRHSHQVDECEDPNHHERIQPVGHLNLIADGLHNLLDGAIIGASFLTSPAVGLATTIAVILHEIPQEIGDLGVLLHAGFSRGRAVLFNALSASLAIAGVIAALLVGGETEQFTQGFLALAAGGFLYIAGSDLVPELHKTTDPKKSLAQFGAILIGIILMLALTWLE
ncbi:MAG: ZIP family metal transporter [Candidatus Vogelbacteria bacterium]|nr:ZIP family metal transporter [Candidatus Vogelbacteria bacterium]